MSTGLFNLGRSWIIQKAFRNEFGSSTLSIGLYTNTPGTLTSRNTLAQIVACAGSGYAAIAVPANNWQVTNVLATDPADDAIELSLAAVDFTASANWGNISGAYLFDPTNSIALAWKDFVDASGAPTAYPLPSGAKLRVQWLDEILGL